MSTLHHRINLKFIEKLSKSNKIDVLKITQLRELLMSDQKYKVEDFVKIFSQTIIGDAK